MTKPTFRSRCPECRADFAVPDRYLGRNYRCEYCRHLWDVQEVLVDGRLVDLDDLPGGRPTEAGTRRIRRGRAPAAPLGTADRFFEALAIAAAFLGVLAVLRLEPARAAAVSSRASDLVLGALGLAVAVSLMALTRGRAGWLLGFFTKAAALGVLAARALEIWRADGRLLPFTLGAAAVFLLAELRSVAVAASRLRSRGSGSR